MEAAKKQKTLNGILLIDKPEGLSSARAISMVKRRPDVLKIGHAGTLDPFATGLLVCCLGKATRLSRFFLGSDKEYEGLLRLGQETDTQDLTGEIIKESPLPPISDDMLRAAFEKFKGEIQQVPPVFSALKHKGVPLYKLARKGKPVEKPPRDISIHALEIIDMQLPDIRFKVLCSSGTYVRTLAADIGRELGCGAHLRELRRTASGRFSLDKAIKVEDLEAAGDALQSRLVSMSDATDFMPFHRADSALIQKIRFGRPLKKSDIPGDDDGLVRVIDETGELIALIEAKKSSDLYNYSCVFIR